MHRTGSRGRARLQRLGVLVLTLALGCGLVVSASVPASAAGSPVVSRGAAGATADALPTVQIDGIAWTQVIVGNVVFAGGQFSTARPAGAAAGTQTTPRSNLLAYRLDTGELITSFAPTVNGAVRALAVSYDKKTLYVGGAFTEVNGAKRLRFAALDVTTGALRSMAPEFNNQVRAIKATSTTIYVGGSFTKVGATVRSRLAAFTTSGQLRSWRPAANGPVQAMTITPDRRRALVVGGSFTQMGPLNACGMSRLNLNTGAIMSWPINSVVQDCGPNSAITSLTADSSKVYGAGYAFGGGNYEGVFAATASGQLSWLQDCRGDTYGVAVANSRVYSVGHAHNCAAIGGFPETTPQTIQRALAATTDATGTVGTGYKAFTGRRSPSLVNWFPTLNAGTVSGMSQGAWSVEASGPYVVLGGEFTTVNRVPQQGLVRLATADHAPKKQGPQDVSAGSKPTVVANPNSSVTVSWRSSWDRDDQSLTYSLLRNNNVVFQQTSTSHFWDRRTLSFTDTGLTPGAQVTWKVRVTDPDGNEVTSGGTSLVIPQAAPADNAKVAPQQRAAPAKPTEPTPDRQTGAEPADQTGEQTAGEHTAAEQKAADEAGDGAAGQPGPDSDETASTPRAD